MTIFISELSEGVFGAIGHEETVGHDRESLSVPGAGEVGDRDKNPDRNDKGNKGDNLGPPGRDHDVGGDVGPIEGKVQEAHAPESAGDELDGVVVGSEPAEDGK